MSLNLPSTRVTEHMKDKGFTKQEAIYLSRQIEGRKRDNWNRDGAIILMAIALITAFHCLLLPLIV